MLIEPEHEARHHPRRGDPRARIRQLTSELAADFEHRLGAGDLAQLRRLRPDVVPAAPAFWRLAVGRLDPDGYRLAWGYDRDEQDRRWSVILAAMATLHGFHDGRVGFGRALAEAGVSEGRFLRLLRARGPALFDTLRVTVHQVANQAQRLDCAELAELVLTSGRDDEDPIRRRIARAYYSQPRAESSPEHVPPAD